MYRVTIRSKDLLMALVSRLISTWSNLLGSKMTSSTFSCFKLSSMDNVASIDAFCSSAAYIRRALLTKKTGLVLSGEILNRFASSLLAFSQYQWCSSDKAAGYQPQGQYIAAQLALMIGAKYHSLRRVQNLFCFVVTQQHRISRRILFEYLDDRICRKDYGT